MSKVRVYEVARELGMKNKELVALFQSLGFSEVRNHMSAVEAEVVDRVRRKLERKENTGEVVEERIRPTVVKRRARAVTVPEEEPAPRAPVIRRPAAAKDGAAREPKAPEVVAAPPPEAVKPVAPEERTEPVETAASAVPAAEVPEAVVTELGPPRAEPHEAVQSTAGQREAGQREAGQREVGQREAGQREAGQREAPPEVGPEAKEQPAPEVAPPAAELETEAPAPREDLPPREEPAPTRAASTGAVEPAPGQLAAVQPAAVQPAAVQRGLGQPGVGQPGRGERPAAEPRRSTEAPQTIMVDTSADARRPSQPPKSGIEVWEGRPGVPMPQRPRTGARRTTYDPRAAAPAGARFPFRPGGRRGAIRPGVRPGRNYGKHQRKGPVDVSTKEMSDEKKVIKIEGETSLQSLAHKMSLKATDVLMKLLSMGMTGVHINTSLDADTAKLLAGEFGWTVEDVSIDVEEELEQATALDQEEVGEAHGRPPIVTVMGHVDHGKTTLLDSIRKADVASGEAGGITQHIGAYRVETKKGTICFLDTPGHEAFTAMRARGASVTDIVILVCAADDGVMPQTREAISHAKSAGVPIIVAINKMDKPGVDAERVMRELSNEGLQPEDWGGDTIMVKVSAKSGEGIDQLLEMVLLQAEVLELTAHPQKLASGVVVEALLDRGRGPVARVLVQDGTLSRGDVLLCGAAYGKIRAMTDEKGRSLKEAGAATPVEVLGLNAVPDAGDPVHAVNSIKAAETLAGEREKKRRKATARQDVRMNLDQLVRLAEEGEQLELKVILKSDVQGSAEALAQALQKLTSKKVKLTLVHNAVGGITETDVNLAAAAGGVIIGFNVRPAGKARRIAEQEGVEIRLYSVIYEAIEDVHRAMEGLLPSRKVEKELGKAAVRQVFRITKVGVIAGCIVSSGIIRRSAECRLVRDSVVVWTGKLSSLKRFKDDAREVREGLECGIGLEGYNDLKEGDIIEAFEFEEVKSTLDD